MMNRVVFMGTPDFAVPALQALLDAPEAVVVGVVTQPDRPAGRGKRLRQPPVKRTAVAADLPIYQPRSLRKREAIAPIAAWEPDLIVVAAFGQILRPHLLDLPRLGCVNVHASLLPRWRGASPIQRAIWAGDAETGVTLMQMDVGLDTGDMLAMGRVRIGPDETAETLHDRLAELGGVLLRNHIDDLLHGRLEAIAQDEAQMTYAPMIKKEDGRLDWGKPAVELARQMRALTPWPGAFAFWEGEMLKVRAAVARPEVTFDLAPVGKVLFEGGEVFVKTAVGCLQLQVVQLAGKRAMNIDEFIRGRTQLAGSVLE